MFLPVGEGLKCCHTPLRHALALAMRGTEGPRRARCEAPHDCLPPRGAGSLAFLVPVGSELGEGFDFVEDVVVDVGAAEEGEFQGVFCHDGLAGEL